LYGPQPRPPSWPARFSFRTEIATSRLPVRLAAFLIDALLMALASLAAYAVTGSLGAFRFSPEWLRRYGSNLDAWPDVPPLEYVDLTAVFAVSVAIGVVLAIYAAVCWARFGGLPGQRAVGLHVVDYETGRRLSWAAAAVRSLAVFGALGSVMAVYCLLTFYRLTSVAIADTASGLIGPDSPLYRWSDLMELDFLLGSAWLIFVFVSTATNRARRGVQDRIAGSIVVAVRKVPLAWHPVGPVYGPPGWGWPGQPQGSPPGAPGSAPAPAPGWTPPGYWSPPGHPVPSDWSAPPVAPPQPSSGAPAASGPAPEAPPEPSLEPVPEPTLEDAPWKRSAEPTIVALAGHEAAPLSRRVSAYLIDGLIVGVLFWMAFSNLLPATSSGGTGPSERISIFAGLAGGVMQLAYFVLGWTYWRATVGQRIAGIAVIGESGGKAISAMDALVRWAVLQGPFALVTIVPLAIAPFVAAAAAGWSVFLLYSTQNDERGQGFHDHFVKTRVVAV
jgi:uncharacterized RDD family membrane protein YckC